MAKYSPEDIIQIHRIASATQDKKYHTSDGKVYIGLDTGHLRRETLKDIAQEETVLDHTEDIKNINKDIVSLELKHKQDIDANKCFAISMAIIF